MYCELLHDVDFYGVTRHKGEKISYDKEDLNCFYVVLGHGTILHLRKNIDAKIIEDNIGSRWRNGIPHHPLSIELVKHIQMMDVNDVLDISTGGDGDNGEALLYLMDSYFEMKGFS